MHLSMFGVLALSAGAILSSFLSRPATAQSGGACGVVVSLKGHDDSRTKYSLAGHSANATAVLVLLPGGSGFVDLDANGCARRLKGNSLVRTRGLFHGRGFATALVDAPSDHQAADGLGGFRIAPAHAEDIGRIVDDLRRRTGLPVWLAGTSRGSISAANAAARLQGTATPDGLVLTSPVTSGRVGGFKAWVAQTVFSVRLAAIRVPVLVVVHAADKCIRTPPELAARIAAGTDARREQIKTITGGPGWRGPPGLKACRGRAPHGFAGQKVDVTEGIVRFIRGGRY